MIEESIYTALAKNSIYAELLKMKLEILTTFEKHNYKLIVGFIIPERMQWAEKNREWNLQRDA